MNHLDWATSISAGFIRGYTGSMATDKEIRGQFKSVLSSCLDYALVWSFMLVALFALPMQISAFVNDRREGLRDLLSSMGLSRVVYWAGNGAFVALSLVVNLGVLVGGGLWLGLPVLLHTNRFFLAFLLVATAVAYVGTAAVLSNMFGSTRMAVMAGYLLCLLLIFVIPGLMINGFENEFFPPLHYMAFPPFASFRAMHSMVLACTSLTQTGQVDKSNRCLQRSHFEAAWTGMVSGLGPETNLLDHKEKMAAQSMVAMTYLLVECVLVWLLALMLDVVLRAMPHVPLDDSSAKTKHGRSCMVEARDVRKTYMNGFEAVKGISMDVYKGDSIGLLGPNGAGKTTLCSMVTGLLGATAGTIKVWYTRKDSTASNTECSLGICAQHTTLFPDLTVREHLLTFARIKYMQGDQATIHVNHMLAKVGLADKAECFPHQLSGGMQRKLAICLAVVGEPGLVVLDEPTTGLDPMAREAIWQIVRQSTAGCNLVTTHMLEEAEALSTNIFVMSEGRVVAQGSPQELKEKYGSGYALSIECKPDMEADVVKALAKLLKMPNLAPRKRTRAGQLEFGIGSDANTIGGIFMTLNKGATAAGVLRWGISQSTLQDAYMAIVTSTAGQYAGQHAKAE